MHTEQAVVTLRCNQNCVFCDTRRPDDDELGGPETAAARIRAALAAGARHVILTGGEPALRRDLAGLVAAARQGGASGVTLVTNAALLVGGRAAELRAAGLTEAVVKLPGWGPRLDEVTRNPGGLVRTVAGLRALVAAGVTVDVLVTLARSTRALAPAVPAGLRAALAGTAGIRELALRAPHQAPDPDELLGSDEAVAAILAVDERARAVGLVARVELDATPPPCRFPAGGGWHHLFRLGRASGQRPNHVLLPACDGCAVRGGCPGLARASLEREPAPALRPITDDRTRRRLTLGHTTLAEAVAKEFVTVDYPRELGRPAVEEHVVRVNFNCNQRCRFCFVSTHLPAVSDEAVRAAIRAAGARGAKVALSGGEPTLNPRLPEYLRLAHEVSPLPVVLQTNAVRLRDEGYVRELQAAGLGVAFVALHGSRPEVSDAVTGVPGTFAATVAGLDHLVRAGVTTVVNFVICRANLGDLAPVVRLVGARWPGVEVNVSFIAASTEVVPLDRALVPSYSEALPMLEEAIAEAARVGVKLRGFVSMCGLPLCLVPDAAERYATLRDACARDADLECVKPPACARCALEPKCFGLRHSYAALYGTDEVRPVEPPGAAPEPTCGPPSST
jgi:MoaA/NifB/PqqE/SkfB family radical SAM enzyme